MSADLANTKFSDCILILILSNRAATNCVVTALLESI